MWLATSQAILVPELRGHWPVMLYVTVINSYNAPWITQAPKCPEMLESPAKSPAWRTDYTWGPA